MRLAETKRLKNSMETKIQIAKKGQAQDCLICVKNSNLWDAYFKANPYHESTLEEMISKKQVYVATNKDDKCIGFMSVINNGCFGKYSYLSILAVNEKYRNNGIGELLVNKFETIGFKRADRVFILVSDFNKIAQKFYRKLGYEKVGNIPNLFKVGVSENLLVKYKINPGFQYFRQARYERSEMQNIFPDPIKNLPEADIPLDGIKAYLSQAKDHQLIFMQFEKDVDLPEHSHAAQVGFVLSGKIELTIDGTEKVYSKGDIYFIPENVKHSGKIYAGYADITFFDEATRYKEKK